MEVGRVIGRAVSWPFTYGYSLIWGDEDDQKSKDQRMNQMRRPQSLRRTNDSGIEWVLSPTIGSIGQPTPGYKSGSGIFGGGQDDISMISFMGSLDDIQGTPGPFNHPHSHHTHNPHTILGVPIPIEEETFPAYLAGLPDVAFPRYRLSLPKKTKILVLDLDETLVHSTSASAEDCDFLVEVLVEHLSCLYYVHKRPFVEHFIEVVSNWYQLAIYTASLREYADPVVNMLDKGRRLFKKRLFRSACLEKDGMYLKDLSMVDQDLSRVFLLDNSTVSFILNPENGVFIDSWYEDKKDTALLDLLPFLDALRFVEDVRSILSLRAFN